MWLPSAETNLNSLVFLKYNQSFMLMLLPCSNFKHQSISFFCFLLKLAAFHSAAFKVPVKCSPVWMHWNDPRVVSLLPDSNLQTKSLRVERDTMMNVPFSEPTRRVSLTWCTRAFRGTEQVKANKIKMAVSWELKWCECFLSGGFETSIGCTGSVLKQPALLFSPTARPVQGL